LNRVRKWLSTLVGFYRPTQGENLDFVTKLLYSARSVILVISAQAAIISGLLSLYSGNFNLILFTLVLIGYVSLHMVSNLSNDYFGYTRGNDIPGAPRLRYTPHPIASGYFTKYQVKMITILIFLIPLAITYYLFLVRGTSLLLFAVPGFLLLYLYDASRVTLKSIGLGEIASFLVWGPLMITGGYFVITGTFSILALAISIPYGLGVMSILLGKHIDQIEFDSSIGQKTLPVLVGEKNARVIVCVTIPLMYMIPVILLLTLNLGLFPMLVILLNIPLAIRTVKSFLNKKPEEPPKGYVGWPLWYHRFALVHNRRFGWVYIAGLALSVLLRFLNIKP
jgi:1,4-dihydroxy-2-naphthoate octaprenyltransferase